jgi:hypothetical protein
LASTPELISILGDINSEARLWNRFQSVNFSTGSERFLILTWSSMWNIIGRWSESKISETRLVLWNSTLFVAPARTAKKTLLLFCSAIVAWRWNDVFDCCLRSHRHGLRRKHHSSVVVYGPLPSNGRLLWFHNSCFQEICYNIYTNYNLKILFTSNHVC